MAKNQVAPFFRTRCISVWQWELNPDMVAHLSTKRARHRLTLLIKANVLTTTPDHHEGCLG